MVTLLRDSIVSRELSYFFCYSIQPVLYCFGLSSKLLPIEYSFVVMLIRSTSFSHVAVASLFWPSNIATLFWPSNIATKKQDTQHNTKTMVTLLCDSILSRELSYCFFYSIQPIQPIFLLFWGQFKMAANRILFCRHANKLH